MAKKSTTGNSRAEKGNGRLEAFSLAAPTATEVKLVGDFTQWQQKPIRMEKSADGVWRTSLKLTPGAHAYRFLVDGQWWDDPACKLHVSNPYGSQDAVRQVV